jgi:hypothetical protein
MAGSHPTQNARHFADRLGAIIYTFWLGQKSPAISRLQGSKLDE